MPLRVDHVMLKDFEPICELVNASNVLFVRSDSGNQISRGSGVAPGAGVDRAWG